MKVLLISANTEQINVPVLPLGMACVGAAAARAGHDLRTLNLMTVRHADQLLSRTIADFDPDVIGVSVRNIDDQNCENPRFLLDSVKNLIAECRRRSRAYIVLGGAGFSIFPHEALAYLDADMGIQGEGEAAFTALLDKLGRKTAIDDIPGLILPRRPAFPPDCRNRNLDILPPPLPESMAIPREFEDQVIWLPFQTRRGCPMDCLYCSTGLIEGRILRKHSPEYAVQQLSAFSEAGFDRFFFVDNTFNLPPSYAEALCDAIIASGLKITWRCILYPLKVSEGLVEKMAQAGCREAALGFESGSDAILKIMNKRFTTADIRSASALLKTYGIGRLGFLLFGGPGETRDTVRESLDFAESLETEAMKLTAGIRIYPGTGLARIAEQEGVIEAGADLLKPRFYLKEEIGNWILEKKEAYLGRYGNWMG